MHPIHLVLVKQESLTPSGHLVSILVSTICLLGPLRTGLFRLAGKARDCAIVVSSVRGYKLDAVVLCFGVTVTPWIYTRRRGTLFW